jgi:hypothetical protein
MRESPTATWTLPLACIISLTLGLALDATASDGNCPAQAVPIGVGATQPFAYVPGQEYALVQGVGSGNYQYLDFSGLPCYGDSCLMLGSGAEVGPVFGQI